MTESAKGRYQYWFDRVGDAGRSELSALTDDAREDAFYRDLAFGTGGLRGVIGLGPNRMNTYTVGKATQGLADYLNANFESPSVVLCRDTRRGSEKFVRRVAGVLAGNGVRSYLFDRVEPTPALSFAVRELGCSAGVNITASHNPAVYNGYKVYSADGCQITVDTANAIQEAIDPVDCFDGVKPMLFEDAMSKGLVQFVPERVLDRYVEETLKCSAGVDCGELSVVYTPLHGVGLECVSRVFDAIGVGDVAFVDEQCDLDGESPTCPSPNPEFREALELGLAYCDKSHSDLLVATDPDADRLGVAVLHAGEYKLLSGNDLGLLLLDFLASKAESTGADLSRKVAFTTIASAPMADEMARVRGFELRRTLTGFKFIGEQVGLLDSRGRKADFLMGFEESNGCLVGTSVRDKDAVVSSMLACELAAYWKARGLDLCGAMECLGKTYGFWASSQECQAYEGPQGASEMAAIMAAMRSQTPAKIAGTVVSEVIDYADGATMPAVNPSDVQTLPPANVVELRLEDGSRVLFRPSGTEPKAKSYLYARGSNRDEANAKLALLQAAAKQILKGGNQQ